MQPLFTFAAALLSALPAHWVFRKLGARLGFRRSTTRFFSALVLAGAIVFPLQLLLPEERFRGLALVVGCALVAGTGADALRLPRWLQVVIGAALAALAVQQGFAIREIKPPFLSDFIALGAWSQPLSIAWMLAVVYAVLLCRRVAGLATGLVGIVSLAFLAVLFLVFASPPLFTTALACALAGAAWGTFFHDFASLPYLVGFSPRTGKSLTLQQEGAASHWVLGFALAILSVEGMLKNTAFLLLAAPLLLLGVPVVEATYAFVYGGAKKPPAFAIGRRRELLHEALLRKGLSPRRLLFVFMGLTLYLSALAILLAWMVRVSFLAKLLVLAVFGLLGFVIFFCLARILSRIQARPGGAETTPFLEVPVASLNMEQTLDKIEDYVRAGTPHQVATSDSSAIVKARQDEEFAAALKSAALVTPDGTGVVWMARVLGLPIAQRVSGIDLLEKICARAARKGWRIFLLGAAPGVAEAAGNVLQQRYPGLSVAGCQHGYFSPEEESEVIARIAALRPEVLFVGFGIPIQEKWIARHKEALGAPVAIGVGGSFDVISGRLQRAPGWMQRAGLEWLYRTLQQPKRLPRLLVLPRLFLLTLKEALLNRREED
jgi:N-acetylglucosaminyldiphosphoundecaprenol N-acetyl-beta-D-mannosaminyltransferase